MVFAEPFYEPFVMTKVWLLWLETKNFPIMTTAWTWFIANQCVVFWAASFNNRVSPYTSLVNFEEREDDGKTFDQLLCYACC